jgi:hypothetical protein
MDNEMLLASARAILTTTPLRWQSLTERLPADLLGRAPRAGEWSAVECLRHLLLTEREAFPVRIRAFLAGHDFPAYDPDREDPPDSAVPPSGLAAEFAQQRAENLRLLDTIGPRILLARQCIPSLAG